MQNQKFLNFFKKLQIIFYAILTGPSIFLTIVFFLNLQETEVKVFEQENLFLIISGIIAFSNLFLANLVPKMLINKIQANESLDSKLQKYQSASIIKYALLEAPAIIATVGYLLTANVIFVGIALAMLLVLFLQQPNKTSIEQELEI